MFMPNMQGMLGGSNPMMDQSQANPMPDNPLMGQQPSSMSPLVKQMLMMKMMQQGQGQNDPSTTAGFLANITHPLASMFVANKMGIKPGFGMFGG